MSRTKQRRCGSTDERHYVKRRKLNGSYTKIKAYFFLGSTRLGYFLASAEQKPSSTRLDYFTAQLLRLRLRLTGLAYAYPRALLDVMIGPNNQEKNRLTFGGNPVPDTNFRSLFHFPRQCGMRDFLDLLAFLIQSAADFHNTRRID